MAEDKKYFWLKLPTDFFKDRSMKKLKRMAAGPTYLVIYQKLLLLSLENEGNIYFEGIEDSFEDEMSLELDENVEDIQMTLMFLAKYNLIDKKSDNHYFMTQVPEMIGSETDSARRKRKSRNKIVTLSQQNENLSQGVTKCPAITEQRTKKKKNNNNNKKNTEENVVVDVETLKKEFDQQTNGDVSIGKLKKLVDEKGVDTVKKYIAGYSKFTGDKRNPEGFLIKAIEEEWTIPPGKKTKTKNGKSWKDDIEVDEVYLNDCGR
jgi:predicted phage replisome organizer